MKRREFMQSIAAAGALSPLAKAGSFNQRLQQANRQSGRRKRGTLKKLVVIFLRGGNDGLNTMIPIESSQYNKYSSHRSSLAIPLNQILDISDPFFGLHPSLAPLVPIHAAGNLSFIHCVGYPNADRSHFESEAYYETAIPGVTTTDGWLNRFLQHTSGGNIRGLSIGWNVQQSVLGPIPVPISTNFGTVNIEDDSSGGIAATLQNIYGGTPTPGNTSVYEAGDSIFQMIASFQNRNYNCYDPATADPNNCVGVNVQLENGAQYPTNASIGRFMRHAAQMLKDDDPLGNPDPLGVEFIVTDTGGYDNHAAQLNPDNGHGVLLSNLAQAMAAFYTDMGPTRMQDVTVMVVSEFGRRVKTYGSDGTDHGVGGLAMIMNNNVTTGTIGGGGAWPGLNGNQLVDGIDLDWTTDFRDIYWEVLSNHMGLDNPTIGNIIPGHTYSPVGFLA